MTLTIDTPRGSFTLDRAAVAAVLADPALSTVGTVYADVLRAHGVPADAWTALTLGTPRLLVWKEGQGFVLTEFGRTVAAEAR